MIPEKENPELTGGSSAGTEHESAKHEFTEETIPQKEGKIPVISTAGWLFNPEELFKILNELNEERKEQGKKLIKVELYPTFRKFDKFFEKLIEFIPELENWIPPIVNADYVEELKKEYPNVPISGVHLEFNFNPWEEIYRTTFGEEFFPKVPGMKPSDRIKMALKQRAFQGAWMGLMGPARKERGVKLAQELHKQSEEEEEEEEEGVAITAHANVIVGFGVDKIREIKETIAAVFVEDERPYRSPVMKKLQKKLESQGIEASLKDLVSNLECLKLIVEEYELDGLVFAADHPSAEEEGLIKMYNSVEKMVKMLHVAGTEADKVHTTTLGEEIDELLEKIQKPIKVVYDVSPLEMKGKSYEEQKNYVRKFAAQVDGDYDENE